MKKIETKLRKILTWKNFGQLRSMIKWDGLEIEDVRSYYSGDDIRHINWKQSAKYNELLVNRFSSMKDSDVHLFFDYNKNWLGYDINKQQKKDKIYELSSEVVILSRRLGCNIYMSFLEQEKLKTYYVWKSFERSYSYINKVDNLLGKVWNKYFSGLEQFLNFQKTLQKKHIIVIFSDFLQLSSAELKTLKVLSIFNEVFLFQVSLGRLEGINYNNFYLKEKNNSWLKLFNTYNI